MVFFSWVVFFFIYMAIVHEYFSATEMPSINIYTREESSGLGPRNIYLWPCKAWTTLMLVSKNLFKQLERHFSSVLSKVLVEIGLFSLHFLKHMLEKLWMDICTFDLEFSDSMNCKISFLEVSSRFCNAVWEI